MNSRINHKNIVTKKNRLSNLFYVRQAVASATFFINAGMTQTVEDLRLATDGWLDLTRQTFHLLDYSSLSGRTIPIYLSE